MRLLAALLALATPACALAAEPFPADVVAEFGLLGLWSPDCARPPTPTNPRVEWRAENGQIVHTVSFDGQTIGLRDTVAAAVRLGPDTLRLSLLGVQGLGTVTVQMLDGRIHAIRSVAPGGHVFYDAGIELATGRPAMSSEPCVQVIG